MKKPILLTGILLFFIAIASFSLHKYKAHKGDVDELQGGGDDIEYFKWELKRLADPATGKIPENIRSLELAYAATLPNDANSDNADSRVLAAGWIHRGPYNIGGRTRSFAADVNNEAILLAGTTSGGMWRSADSGKSWNLTTPLAVEQGVSCLAQDTRVGHSSIWYYATGEAYGASASASGAYFFGTGVYRSLDDGQTWSILPSTSVNSDNFGSQWQATWSMANNPHAPDSISQLYISTVGGIQMTTDTGRTWTKVLGTSLGSNYYTDVKVSDSGIVYATMSSDGSQVGIFRSADGVTFTNITPPGFPATYNRIVGGISKKDPNQVYFIANTPGYGMPDTNFLGQVEWNSLWKYKYISGNGSGAGGVWYDLSANLPSHGGLFDKYNCQGSYDMFVTFLPTDTATVFIGGTDIFRSTTGFFDTTHSAHIGGYMIGASLPSIKTYPNHHPDQHVAFFSHSTPYIMYSSNDGGVYRTNNDTAKNVTWTSLNNGYETTMFYTVASDHYRSGGQVLIGGAQDNNSLFDNSPTNVWTKPIFGDGSFCDIADSGTVFYYSSQQGKMFKTQMDTTNGTVVDFRRIDPIGGKGYQFVNPYVVDPNNNHLMYLAGGKYLWRNNDLSAIPFSDQYDSINTNWVRYTDSVPLSGSTITAVAVSTTPANRVYYGTDGGRVYIVNNANVGTPIPVDITSLSGVNRFPGGGAYVSSIAVDPANGNNVVVTFSNYGLYNNIYYTTNGGTSWTKEGGNLSSGVSPSIRWAAIQHVSGGRTIYWIGASTGLYAVDSMMGNTNVWVQQGTNTIGNAVCDMVDVRQSDGLVAVATHSHGIYSENITNINQINTTDDIQPQVTNVDVSVYPNPFTQTATLSFTMAHQGNVILRIFDEQGRLVQESDKGNMQPGNHTIQFDAVNRPAGVYFCNLIAGGNVYTKRVVLIK